MFSQSLVQALIDLFTNTTELVNCYMMDDCHEINQSVLDNSKNILYFRSTIISKSDIEVMKKNLQFSKSKKMYILSLFLNPDIVKDIIEEYSNVVFFSIYHSTFLNDSNREDILVDDKELDYTYNSGFLGSEYLCKLFRKLIFNFFDDF